MIAQHKSQGNLNQSAPQHHNFEMGSSTGDLSYEGDSNAQRYRARDNHTSDHAYQSEVRIGRQRKASGYAGTEMRKNQRLEPLVQKRSRIAIANRDRSYDSKLEQINESKAI